MNKWLVITRCTNLCLIIATSVAVLTACGGTGGGGGGATPTPLQITGTAAMGAPFADASITVYDRTGAAVGQTTVNAAGGYTVDVPGTAQPPFVVVATRTSLQGDQERLVGVLGSASQTRVNITPVTTVVAALLSPTGRPEDLVGGSVTPASIEEAVDRVQASLASVLQATGQSGFDPLSGVFEANGADYDRLLDSIRVVIEPVSTSATQVQVVVVPSGTADPVSVRFDSSAQTLPTLPTVTANDLPPAGASALLADLLARASSCYNLPLSERVIGTAVNGLVTGGETSVLAPVCRNLFVQNAGAISYRNSGSVVASDRAFSGLFRDRTSQVQFTAGAIEYRNGDDTVVSFRVRVLQGGVLVDENSVSDTVTPVDGALRFKGNQYQFPGEVLAYHQLRRFPTQNQSQHDYLSAGYNLNVRNVQTPNGPLFARVVVTTPRGNTITLVPGGGTDFLVVDKGQGPTGTSFVRLASAFVGSQGGSPATTDTTNLVFVSPQWTDDQLEDSGRLGQWTFRYHLASDPGAVAATQVFRNLSRALSIRELRARQWAVFTPSLLQALASTIPGDDLDSVGRLYLASEESTRIDSDGGGDGWVVPAGALPPTGLTLFGRYQGKRFTDQVSVSTSARSATVPCTPLAGVNQCGSNGFYQPGAVADGIHLLARDSGNRQFATFYAFYGMPVQAQP
jgi:hypothetical protein